MPRRKKKGYRKKSTLPLAIVAPMAYTGYQVAKAAMTPNNEVEVIERLTFYHKPTGTFRIMGGRGMETYGPILAGAVIHKIANKLGVNRMLSSAGVPWIRV